MWAGVSPFQQSFWMWVKILAAGGESCKQGLVLGTRKYSLHGLGTLGAFTWLEARGMGKGAGRHPAQKSFIEPALSAADQNASAVMEGIPKPWLSYLTMGFG